jgi:hypothetical protein
MGKNGRFTNTDVKGFKGKEADPGEGKHTHALGDNLRVRVQGGHSTYVFIYRAKTGSRRGKKTVLTYTDTGKADIADARQWARDQNTLIAQGIDPYDHRRAKQKAADLAALRTKTLGQIAQEYYDKRSSPETKNAWCRNTTKHMGYRLKTLQTKMDIAKLDVDKITSGDVEKVINDYGQRAPMAALGYLDLIFGAMQEARKQGCYQGDNPAHKTKLALNIKHTSKHHYGWHYDELPRLWNLLFEAETACEHDGMLTTAQAAKAIGSERAKIYNLIKSGLLPAKQFNIGKNASYLVNPVDLLKLFPNANINQESSFGEAHLAIPVLRFLLLTLVRCNEANEMRFDEINWSKELWTIPADRTKSKREHVVPLVGPALAILEKMQARREGDAPYVFAHGHSFTGADLHVGQPLTNSCVRDHLKRVTGDRAMTVHSFRRGGGSWAASQFIHQAGMLHVKYGLEFRRAVLGHAVSSGLDYVYSADASLEKPCRVLLNDWANYLVDGPSKPSQSAELLEFPTRKIASA